MSCRPRHSPTYAQLLHGFCGKRIPLWGRNWADSMRRMVSSDQSAEFLALRVGNGGAQVLNLNQPLA